MHIGRVRTDRDTGSVEPGSEQIFGSVSGSGNKISCILCSRDTFCLRYRYSSWFFRYRTCILVLVRRSTLSVSVLTMHISKQHRSSFLPPAMSICLSCLPNISHLLTHKCRYAAPINNVKLGGVDTEGSA